MVDPELRQRNSYKLQDGNETRYTKLFILDVDYTIHDLIQILCHDTVSRKPILKKKYNLTPNKSRLTQRDDVKFNIRTFPLRNVT